MKRLPFLDWMRGLAVVIMIQCHVFNSFVRPDAHGAAYILSQVIGGLAAPLFLFMAGMTLAFQMDSLERRNVTAMRRWAVSLWRGGYVLGIAFLFRLFNWATSWPYGTLADLLRVDILNCMGVALMVFSTAAVVGGVARVRFAVAAALVVAAFAPVLAHLEWGATPVLMRQYLAPGSGAGYFPLFPYAAHVGFGLGAGTLVKRAAGQLENLMRWCGLIGLALVAGGHYAAHIPYSIYRQSNFWTDSPVLVLMDLGVMQMMLAFSYLWTQYAPGTSWSWMQCMGKNSLMVYWVHIMLVYGNVTRRLHRNLSIPGTVLAFAATTALMVAMSAAWLWWKSWRQRVSNRAVPRAFQAHG